MIFGLDASECPIRVKRASRNTGYLKMFKNARSWVDYFGNYLFQQDEGTAHTSTIIQKNPCRRAGMEGVLVK